jgi:hypothetical protein
VCTSQGISLILLDTLNKTGRLFSLGGLSVAFLFSLYISNNQRKNIRFLIGIGHLAVYSCIAVAVYLGYLLRIPNLYAHFSFVLALAALGFLIFKSVKNRSRHPDNHGDKDYAAPSPLAGFWGLVITSALTWAAGISESELVLYLAVSTCILAAALVIEGIQSRIRFQQVLNLIVTFIRIALYLASAIPILYFVMNGANEISRDTLLLLLNETGIFAIISAFSIAISISAVLCSINFPVLPVKTWNRYAAGFCYAIVLCILILSGLNMVKDKSEEQAVGLVFPQNNHEVNIILKEDEAGSPALITHRQADTGLGVSYKFTESPDYYTITLTNLSDSQDHWEISIPELLEIWLAPHQSLTLICWMPNTWQVDKEIEIHLPPGTNPPMKLTSQAVYTKAQKAIVITRTNTF